MKKLIFAFLTLGVSHSAYADACSKALAPPFTPAQAVALCTKLSPSGGFTAGTGLTATSGNVTASGGNLVTANAAYGLILTPGTVAATGSVQGDAASLGNSTNVVVTAADGTKGVIFPATPSAGEIRKVVNNANAILKIYPGSGDAINNTAANSAVSVAAYTVTDCIAQSTSQWFCSEGANP